MALLMSVRLTVDGRVGKTGVVAPRLAVEDFDSVSADVTVQQDQTLAPTAQEQTAKDRIVEAILALSVS